ERVCREVIQPISYIDNYYYQNNHEYEYDGYYAGNDNYQEYDEDDYYKEDNYDGYYNDYESYPALRSGKELRPGDLGKRRVGQRGDPREQTTTNREHFQQNVEQEMRNQEQQIPEIQMQQTPINQKKTRIMTDEHKRRMAQNRKMNNACRNCGMKGHFMNECTMPRQAGNEAALNRMRREAGEYNLANDLLNTKANITMAQVYNEIPKQRDNLHQALRRGPPQ